MNEKKTKAMIFNMSKKYQFSTNLNLNNQLIEIINEAKLLGLWITSDMKWNLNTKKIFQGANMRMRILQTAAKYTSSISDLKAIYFSKIRSKLEYASSVWSSGLSQKNINDIERIQRSVAKIILKERYSTYPKALKELRIDSLEIRRKKLSLNLAKKCTKNEKMKHLFPLYKSKHSMKKRKQLMYKVNSAKTERYKKSPIVYMQNLLNDDFVNDEICAEKAHNHHYLSLK